MKRDLGAQALDLCPRVGGGLPAPLTPRAPPPAIDPQKAHDT